MPLGGWFKQIIGRKPKPTEAPEAPDKAPQQERAKPEPTLTLETPTKPSPTPQAQPTKTPSAPKAPPEAPQPQQARPTSGQEAPARAHHKEEPKPPSSLGTPAETLQGEGGAPGATMVLNTIPTVPTAPTSTTRLVARGGAEPGDTFELRQGRITIGRAPESVIQINQPSVSSQHALIRESESRFYLYDMGSTNRTRVNDNPVEGALMGNGSRISMGSTVLFFTQMGSGAAKPVAMGLGSRGTLLAQTGPSKGRNYPVSEGDLIIGRKPGDGGAQVDDPDVNLRHALVRPTPEGCILYDLGSFNGTKLDDVPLAGNLLNNGDLVKFGDAEFEFVQGEAT